MNQLCGKNKEGEQKFNTFVTLKPKGVSFYLQNSRWSLSKVLPGFQKQVNLVGTPIPVPLPTEKDKADEVLEKDRESQHPSKWVIDGKDDPVSAQDSGELSPITMNTSQPYFLLPFSLLNGSF
jgi:hypothetical protein